MWTHHLLIAAILSTTSFISLSATALERTFPSHAKRGVIAVANYANNSILITLNNGATRALSAGTQIKNSDNLIALPSYLDEGSFAVNYTENSQGDIDRIWILSKDEEQLQPSNSP